MPPPRRLLSTATAKRSSWPSGPDGTPRHKCPCSRSRLASRWMAAKRDLEQVHLCLGVPSVPLGHEDRFAVAVLNNLLGGGMSSRLFQNIREKQGLAYAVFSELTPYSDAGMMTVYAGTAKETLSQVIDLTI